MIARAACAARFRFALNHVSNSFDNLEVLGSQVSRLAEVVAKIEHFERLRHVILNNLPTALPSAASHDAAVRSTDQLPIQPLVLRLAFTGQLGTNEIPSVFGNSSTSAISASVGIMSGK